MVQDRDRNSKPCRCVETPESDSYDAGGGTAANVLRTVLHEGGTPASHLLPGEATQGDAGMLPYERTPRARNISQTQCLNLNLKRAGLRLKYT